LIKDTKNFQHPACCHWQLTADVKIEQNITQNTPAALTAIKEETAIKNEPSRLSM
jgi:hypothetical protein